MVDLFIIDIKHMDTDTHRHYTGVGNETILSNIRRIAKTDTAILFRTPLIPGVNDRYENLMGTVRFIRSLGREALSLELLKYNNPGASKYESIGRTAEIFTQISQEDSYMDALCAALNVEAGVEVVYYHK